tara:strand:- start:63 stop:416 length:354 start_codon:yes stop_codon:yes gene_type:complete
MAGQAKRMLDAAKRKRKLFKSRDERKAARAERKKSKFESKGTRKITKRGRRKAVGASKETKVSKGAVSIEKTKGGEYVKYAKKSKAAGSFRSAFKAGCQGDSKGFEWEGRKYSCARK